MINHITFYVGGDTLVLNNDGLPLSMIPFSTIGWKAAIKEYYLDNVDILNVHEDWIVRSPSVEMNVPSVVMSRTWAKMGRTVKFSRSNVFLRDRYRCQYCNKEFQYDDLTLDHVIPRHLGGKTSWTNIVSACGPCNHKKSHLTLFTPINKARKPSYGELLTIMREQHLIIRHHSWNDYLQWPEHLVSIKK